MSKLKIAKKIIKENYLQAKYGLFDTHNMVCDRMTILYSKDGLIVAICYPWEYFEVFGLTDRKFKKLARFYRQLKE